MTRVLRSGIVLFWIVMVALLVQRNLPQPQLQNPPGAQLQSSPLPPAGAVALSAQEEWMGIYQQNYKVGYLQRRLTPTDSGYRWEERWRMKLRMLNTLQTIATEIRAHTDRQYALSDFSFRLSGSGVVFKAEGKVTDQTLHGQLTSGGGTSPFSFPLREPIYLSATTQMTLRGVALQPGEERRFSIFNPLSMQTDTVSVTTVGPDTLTLKGQRLAVTKVVERIGGTTVYAWLDKDGKVVKEEAALGLVLLRESREDALGGGWQAAPPSDLVTAAAIPVRNALPNPRALTSLRLTVSGVHDATLFVFPPRQHYHDGKLTVTSEEMAALTTYPLPQTNPQFAGELQSTPFLQTTHPRVVAQAQQILGTERDALTATRRLLDWMDTAVEKTPMVGLPTALEVLESKKGDCNEHAVLFTTLARAVGIPARVAAGVVYLDGAFYYHAWSEVWLGQWVAVDPVLHQFPADATHLKFVEGGPEQHIALLKVIGQIGMEVVEYK
jgi:hypothetical protein